MTQEDRNAKPVKTNEDNFDDFHRLWGAAAKTKNYDKGAWLSVERQLLEAGVLAL